MKKSILTLLATTSICASANAFENGVTPLMHAAASNNVSQLKTMLRQGFNPSRVDDNGNTAYCYAYGANNKQAAQILINYGANPRVKCKGRNGYFMTQEVAASSYAGYATSSKYAYTQRSSDPVIASNSSAFRLPSGKFIAYSAVAVGGAAALAGGGGGGGGSDSSGAVYTPPENSNDVDPTSFETAEFYGNAAGAGLSESFDSEFLDIINAQYAYARGYTGAGQKIAVLDTGIDTNHLEFTGQINADLSNTDLQGGDSDPNHGIAQSDHGTNVAGVAAAAKDGAGMHGVAYESTIVPYRIGSGFDSIATSLVADAIKDAVSNKGAEVVNMSFGVPTLDEFGAHNTDATEATPDGVEAAMLGYSDGNDATNTLGMLQLINSVLVNDAILVKSTGNDGTAQPGYANALPLHYDDFDGHFVSVAALNEAGTDIASYSNRCGVAKNHCVIAPGTYTMTAVDGGGYGLASGTSFSAPIVSGSLAVIKDAFGLSAERTLNILYATATDMGAPGVDDVYGHGLINLDLATAPGAELNALSTNSVVSFDNTRVSSSGAMRNIALPSFVVEDELYRTFKISGAGLQNKEDAHLDLAEREKSFAKTAKLETKQINNNVSATFISSSEKTSNDVLESFEALSFNAKYDKLNYGFGFTHNPGIDDKQIVTNSSFLDTKSVSHPYLGLAEDGFLARSSYNIADNWNFETKVFFGDVESDNTQLGKTSSVLARFAYDDDTTRLGLELGFVNEFETLLGSKFEGAFALSENNYTYFTGLTARTALTSKLNLFANAYLGLTKPDSANSSLITDISSIVSHSANAGLEYNLADDKQVGLSIAQPLKVVSGNMKFDVLTGGNIDQGYEYSSFKEDLSNEAMQLDLQAFYKQQLNQDTNVHLGALHKLNAGGEQGETDSSMLVKLKHKF